MAYDEKGRQSSALRLLKRLPGPKLMLSISASPVDSEEKKGSGMNTNCSIYFAEISTARMQSDNGKLIFFTEEIELQGQHQRSRRQISPRTTERYLQCRLLQTQMKNNEEICMRRRWRWQKLSFD